MCCFVDSSACFADSPTIDSSVSFPDTSAVASSIKSIDSSFSFDLHPCIAASRLERAQQDCADPVIVEPSLHTHPLLIAASRFQICFHI
eukprot:9057478-Pyramimonas_sp.AAC.1